MFSALQLTGFFLRGLLTAAIPFAAYFYLRKRQGGRAMPVLAGAVTVMLILIPRALQIRYGSFVPYLLTSFSVSEIIYSVSIISSSG